MFSEETLPFTEELPHKTKSWTEFMHMTMTFQNSFFPFQLTISGAPVWFLPSEMTYETPKKPSFLFVDMSL